MSNNELLDLLREAEGCIEEAAEAFDHLDAKTNDVLRRIKAALAEAQDKPPCSCGQPYPCMKGCPDCCHSQGYLDYCQGDRHAEAQDSATDVVEWHAYGYARNELRSRINGADVTVRFLAPNISDIDTQYSWNVSLWGGATTLDEAKAAAIKAAREMR